MKKRVLVAGAGASGLMAAITAARNGAEVLLIDKKEQVGKKLLKTGNGKCNYSNLYLTERNYHGHDLTFVRETLHRFHTDDLVRFFESLGMLSFARGTYLYPASERAETVVGVLRTAAEELGVETMLNTNVLSVRKTEDGFLVETSGGELKADRVILAMGSEASVKDRNPHTAYGILKSFGHHVYPVLPALVPLFGRMGCEEFWDGVRIQATVVFGEEKETGELQLTREGISGIPVFQISHSVVLALQEGRKPFVQIDFLPHYDRDSLIGFLREARIAGRPVDFREYLSGWLPKKLVFALSKGREELFRKTVADASYEDTEELVDGLKRFRYEVTGHGSAECAQVMQGGLDAAELNDSMESRFVKGLFVTGELLDSDGYSGGYNLHFAFATGHLAGEAAAK